MSSNVGEGVSNRISDRRGRHPWFRILEPLIPVLLIPYEEL